MIKILNHKNHPENIKARIRVFEEEVRRRERRRVEKGGGEEGLRSNSECQGGGGVNVCLFCTDSQPMRNNCYHACGSAAEIMPLDPSSPEKC
jgi:hypothetical protein